MDIVADLHTHTCASDHGFSTLYEMVKEASNKGHVAIGITDHGPAMQDGPHKWRFLSLHRFIPRVIEGVFVFQAAEANVCDPDGHLDLPDDILAMLDYVIASIHGIIYTQHDFNTITEMMERNVMDKRIDVLGHIGDPRYKFDYEKIVKLCKQYGKVIEINNNSFESRAGSKENCTEIARLCKKHDVMITLSSDAHFCSNVGRISEAKQIVEDLDFPEDLIINASKKNLFKYFKDYKNMDIEKMIENEENYVLYR